MMDVRELVTKFSFQVNSEAVSAFIKLLAEAEARLDALASRTSIKVATLKLEPKAVQEKKKKQSAVDKDLTKPTTKKSSTKKSSKASDVVASNSKKIAEETQNEQSKEEKKKEADLLKEKKAKKAYQKRRFSVLKRLSDSRKKRADKKAKDEETGLKEEEKAQKAEEKKQNDLNKAEQTKLKALNKFLFSASVFNSDRYKEQTSPTDSSSDITRMANTADAKVKEIADDFINMIFGTLKSQTDDIKKQEKAQNNLDKAQQAYKKRRASVLKRLSDSRKKRADKKAKDEETILKAEEKAQKAEEKAQNDLNKAQQAYKKRRSSVLKRLSDSRKKRADRKAKDEEAILKAEEKAQKTAEKEQNDLDKAEKAYKKRRSSVLKRLSDSRKRRADRKAKDEQAIIKAEEKAQKTEEKEQNDLNKAQQAYKKRRRSVLKRLNDSRKRRADRKANEEEAIIKAEEKAQKTAEKEQDALDKAEKAYRKRRRSVLTRLNKSRKRRRIRKEKEEEKIQRDLDKEINKRQSNFNNLANTYFNIELLKDAYQLFYNIAEATRQTAVNILRTNDYLNMSIAKIGVITGDTKNASKNFKQLLDISAQTGSEIGVIEEIFNRLSIGKEGLGASTNQILDFTRAIAKLSAFSEGGPAQQGALRQLGQMFGGAYIQAQEWNSIVDGLPAVANKIAKAMGTTREAMTFKIRQQTKDSPAYLIKDVFPQLLKILPEINAEFNRLPPTLDKTLNKAKVGLLGFSLNLKESVKMPELDAFYTSLDRTIQKIFEWANANKKLIGTNINTFFGTLNDVLKSVDTQLKDTKGTAETINNVFYVLNGTVKFLKGTFDLLLNTLKALKPLMEWFNTHPTTSRLLIGGGIGAAIGGRVGGPVGAGVGALGGALVGFANSPHNTRKTKLKAWIDNKYKQNPQASFGTKGGSLTIIQNNSFNGNSATKGEQKQTARMVHPATGNAVSTAIQKRSVAN